LQDRDVGGSPAPSDSVWERSKSAISIQVKHPELMAAAVLSSLLPMVPWGQGSPLQQI